MKDGIRNEAEYIKTGIEAFGDAGNMVETVRGVGYRIDK